MVFSTNKKRSICAVYVHISDLNDSLVQKIKDVKTTRRYKEFCNYLQIAELKRVILEYFTGNTIIPASLVRAILRNRRFIDHIDQEFVAHVLHQWTTTDMKARNSLPVLLSSLQDPQIVKKLQPRVDIVTYAALSKAVMRELGNK